MDVEAILGWTPLHRQCARGDVEGVRALLDAGADANAPALGGWPPLFSAAAQGRAGIVELLLERGARTDVVVDERTAMFYAAASADPATVRAFKSRHRPFTLYDAAQYFVSAHVAAGHRVVRTGQRSEHGGEFTSFVSFESWAIDGPLALDDDVLAPIRHDIVVTHPNSRRIGEIEFERGDRDGEAGELVRWRDQLYTLPLAQHLSKEVVLEAAELRRLLLVAAQRCHEGVVDALLTEMKPTRDAFFAAIQRDHPGLVARLLEDVHAKRDDESALIYAADLPAPRAVSVLLEHGATVDERDRNGWTPLLRASSRTGPRARETVLALLEYGADPNAIARDARTPLMRAAYSGDKRIVERLLRGGADPRVHGHGGSTALHEASAGSASHRGHIGVIEALLAAGADLEARDDEGKTALHYAATPSSADRLPVLERLLEHGADLEVKDRKGRTPLDLAREWTLAELRGKAMRLLSDAAARRR